MKNITLFLFILIPTIAINAQPCKKVKIGMTKEEVIKTVGLPTDSLTLGVSKGGEQLVLWNYGLQQVTILGNKAESITPNYKKLSELTLLLSKKEISPEEFDERINKLNKEECK